MVRSSLNEMINRENEIFERNIEKLDKLIDSKMISERLGDYLGCLICLDSFCRESELYFENNDIFNGNQSLVESKLMLDVIKEIYHNSESQNFVDNLTDYRQLYYFAFKIYKNSLINRVKIIGEDIK